MWCLLDSKVHNATNALWFKRLNLKVADIFFTLVSSILKGPTEIDCHNEEVFTL